MARFALTAALLAGLAIVVPSAAQVGSGRIAFSNEAGIYTANPDGSGLALLTGGGTPRWSPDGSLIAFSRNDAGDILVLVMNPDGTGERLLAYGGSVLSSQPWSPDGTEIAYRSRADVYVVPSAGGSTRRLTFDGGVDPPVWSPAGSQLVYSRVLPIGGSELFVVDSNGGAPVQLTSGPPGATNVQPAWSPDGGTIAFVREVANQRGLYVVHPDGTELHKVADIVDNLYDGPAWSPDGTRLAFSSAVNAGYDPYGRFGREIFVVNADGSGQRRLTELAPRRWHDSAPIWSPDGERIVFERYGYHPRLYSMNADGTCEGKLVADLDEGWSASWQPMTGGPSGPKRCHALSVEATIEESSGRISATVGNEGTEPLTDVVLVAEGATDVTLISGQVHSQQGTCRARLGSITCRFPRLNRGEDVGVTIRAQSRRVTYVADPKAGVGLTTPLSASASQALLESERESATLRYMLPSCTTRTPGGGTIKGTRYADHICGRKGADRILPGGGRDDVVAGAGRDVILASGDGRRDTISCGPGRDRVIADRRDRVARDCERVSPRN